jgi:aminoglycoside phosphotransferase (APT) family kinase protein
MDVAELKDRLVPFVRHHLGDAGGAVSGVVAAPGHAGFSYFFDAHANGATRRYWMRLPPPGVKLEGTADVMRQVTALNALSGSHVPHCPVIWSGTDERWFGTPYFVVDRLDGDTLRDPEWVAQYSPEQRREMGRQTMTALAGIHRVEWESSCRYLGNFWGFETDVTRWDRFYERAAEPQLLALQPRVRELLLAKIPEGTRIGLYHGDFQGTNLLFSREARLLAVVDWELTGIGACLNDLGWICTFNEPRAWAHEGAASGSLPYADELEAMYRDAWGAEPGNVDWFKALAAYKFAIISGLNLSLHRRGKRPDPHWEDIAPSMKSLMEYAMSLLA